MNINEQISRMLELINLNEELDSTQFWNQKLALKNQKNKNKIDQHIASINQPNQETLNTSPDLEFNEQNLKALMLGKKINFDGEFICTRLLIVDNTDNYKKVRLLFHKQYSSPKNRENIIFTYIWDKKAKPQSKYLLKLHTTNMFGTNQFKKLDPSYLPTATNIKSSIDNIFFNIDTRYDTLSDYPEYRQNNKTSAYHNEIKPQPIPIPTKKEPEYFYAKPRTKTSDTTDTTDTTTKQTKLNIDPEYYKDMEQKKLNRIEKLKNFNPDSFEVQQKKRERELAKKQYLDYRELEKQRKLANQPKVKRDPDYIEKNIPQTPNKTKQTPKQSKFDDLQSYFDSIL